MNNQSTTEIRLERKFIGGSDYRQTVDLVRSMPGFFRRAYPPRQVNNLYLDDMDLGDFVSTVEGVSERQKVRLRWYGQQFVAPILELKIKHQLASSKKQWPLTATTLEDACAEISAHHVVAGREPVLTNEYMRDYFTAATEPIRITVDHRLRFGSASQATRHPYRAGDYCVMEIKYPPSEEPRVAELLSQIPYRLSRHSKYRTGVLALKSLGLL